jgi:hypothetical protein
MSFSMPVHSVLRGAGVDPAHLSAGRADAELELPGHPAQHGVSDDGIVLRQVVGHDTAAQRPAVAADLFRAQLVQRRHAGADVDEGPVAGLVQDHAEHDPGQRRRQVAQQGLVVLDLLGAQPDRGDVVVRDEHPQRVAAVDARHSRQEPAPLVLRVAGVFVLEGLQPPGQHLAQLVAKA